MAETIHPGRNVKRFQEMARLKQEGLASLGKEWNQKRISPLESKVTNHALPEQIAKALTVTPGVIKKFGKETGVACFNVSTSSKLSILNSVIRFRTKPSQK